MIARVALTFAQKLFDDAGCFQKLLLMSGLHQEAAHLGTAMVLIDCVAAELESLRDAESVTNQVGLPSESLPEQGNV